MSARREGVVAVVTGAGSGIGRACAVRLARAGHRVLAVGRTGRPLAELAGHLRGEQAGGPSPVEPFPCELGSEEAAARVVQAAAELGSPVVVVHAAGAGGYLDREVWQQEPAAWRSTMAVNLDTAFYLIRLLAPYMRRTGWGRAVMIGSTAGAVPVAAQPAYCASKAGLLGLVRSAAVDLAGFGATCNAVVPGWVRDSAMAEADARREAAAEGVGVDEVWARRDASYPGGRVLTADEVAAVVEFLVGDAAGGVNGEAITVARGSPW
jgi:NAD(P)-dependent dehydrogenase (short-subunit alcohol dehydrogenase family)